MCPGTHRPIYGTLIPSDALLLEADESVTVSVQLPLAAAVIVKLASEAAGEALAHGGLMVALYGWPKGEPLSVSEAVTVAAEPLAGKFKLPV